MKTASIWMFGRVARILVRDESGRVIEMSDAWTNLASAEITVRDKWKNTVVEVVHLYPERVNELNVEWDANLGPLPAKLMLYEQDHSWAGMLICIAETEAQARELMKNEPTYDVKTPIVAHEIKKGLLVANWGDY